MKGEGRGAAGKRTGRGKGPENGAGLGKVGKAEGKEGRGEFCSKG